MMEEWHLFLVTFEDYSTEYVYAYDEQYAATKAEKQYRKVPRMVQLVDLSREHEPAWITKTFAR